MNAGLRARILAFNRQRADGAAAIVEAARLREELAAARASLAGLLARFQALENVTVWAEIDSGKHIAVGDEVRYFARTYRCVKAHTKGLSRSPLDSEYWEVVT